jgi:predicted DNA-binding transcriptional regulator YafY
MEKLLRVLMLLSGIRNYSVWEISEHFDISERTVFRYLSEIERAGFVLDRREVRYRLHTDHSTTKTLDNLFHFSEEEAYLLYRTLAQIEGPDRVKERLVKKLHSLYDFKVLSGLKKANTIEIIKKLGSAIRDKKQALLVQYRSSNSETIGDRKVEPFSFTEDYTTVWCYDVEAKHNKQFRISRMKDAEALSSSWQCELEHRIPFTDAFRMAADSPLATVELILSLKAYNLLIEEYPLSEKYIRQEKNKYRLRIPVADYHGIGRYVQGLPGEVEVVGPDGFKKFLERK